MIKAVGKVTGTMSAPRHEQLGAAAGEGRQGTALGDPGRRDEAVSSVIDETWSRCGRAESGVEEARGDDGEAKSRDTDEQSGDDGALGWDEVHRGRCWQRRHGVHDDTGAAKRLKNEADPMRAGRARNKADSTSGGERSEPENDQKPALRTCSSMWAFLRFAVCGWKIAIGLYKHTDPEIFGKIGSCDF